MNKHEYDIALSFAGEDRQAADELAAALTKNNVRVFYDEYEKGNLWGKDLYEHLSDVYKNKAEFCVMFLSEHYARKLWTNHERKAAQSRAFAENREYILPIRLDDTEIKGILPTVGYLSWQDETISSITQMIASKLGKPTSLNIANPNKISYKNSDSDAKKTRKKYLREHLANDNNLLKEYEDLIRLEEDPRRLAKFEREIKRLKLSISNYENELHELEK